MTTSLSEKQMYLGYYGLTRKPFEAHPTAVYLSETHQEALAVLRYGISEGKQFLLLTGEAGTGKSVILDLFLQSLTENVRICHFQQPPNSRAELYKQLGESFELPGSYRNKAAALLRFGEFLSGIGEQGARVLLLFDDAHLLSPELLEESRLLANYHGSEEILSIFFSGRPTLDEHLNTSFLASLRQRVGCQYQLRPLLLEETAGYIRFRLQRSGAQRLDLFDKEAVEWIQALTGGLPYWINLLCEAAMQEGYLVGIPSIRPKIIERCARRLGSLPGSVPKEEASKGPFFEWLSGVHGRHIFLQRITGPFLLRTGKNTKNTPSGMEEGARRGKSI